MQHLSDLPYLNGTADSECCSHTGSSHTYLILKHVQVHLLVYKNINYISQHIVVFHRHYFVKILQHNFRHSIFQFSTHSFHAHHFTQDAPLPDINVGFLPQLKVMFDEKM